MKKLFGIVLGLALTLQSVLGLDVIQNVARSFVIEAPALDKTDGITPETGLTMTTFVIKAYKKNKAPVTITAALAVFATSTLTSDATNPTDNDTITFTGTLDGTLITEVYRFKTTLAQANDIKIEADAATTLDSLLCGVNDAGCVEGTDYGTGTVASVLVTATTNAATTQVFRANVPGTLGNSFTTAEASTHLSWTGSTLASGVDGLIHDASGYHWFCAPATTWDTLGDMLLTFNYNAEAAPFFQKIRVVANASNEINVQGLGSTVDGLLETNLNTVASSSAWAYKLNQLDITTSAIWGELIAAHVVPDSFGARVARTGVDSRPIDVSSGGAVSPDWANVEAPTTTVGLSGTTFSTGQVVASVAGAVGSVTGSVGSVTGAVGSVTGAVGSVTGLTAANLDATVSSRMATYTQPTGFLAATFPTTVASTTNITGGTITTVTNLTNLPTIPANWLTAAGIASDASTEFATTLMGTTFEGAHTFQHFLQYGAAALFGKYNSSAGTFNFRDLADSKNRIIYTTTATSRATVTLSPD